MGRNSNIGKRPALQDNQLKEPEMPDIKVPPDFLKKLVTNRAEAEDFEKKVKKLREDGE